MIPRSRLTAALAAPVLLIFGVAAACAAGAVGRVLILHTNDVHDHVRPGYDGTGGLPYIISYIDSVRAGRDDVLVLDAGDFTEKGDMVADATQGELTCSLMRRIGYDAVTLGNHDNDQGIEQLRRYETLLGARIVCLNRVDESGHPVFEPSRVARVGGLKIGIIGMIVPQDEGTPDFRQSGRRLAVEAERLAGETDLVVALCHNGAPECAGWSRMAPAVQVFVSGHSHEAMQHAAVVPETGAIIVQAGCYAKWVGRLELEVDRDTHAVRLLDSRLVAMDHSVMAPDAEALALVKSTEERLCPDATTQLFDNPEPVGIEMAWLAAEALRREAGTDIGFCNPDYIIRDLLPSGPVDVNAVFLTGGQRGKELVRTRLSGAEITAYIESLGTGDNQTAWAGLSVTGGDAGSTSLSITTNLDPDGVYSVVMPEREWNKRFLRSAGRAKGKGPLGTREFSAKRIDGSFTSAIKALLLALPREQRDARRIGGEVRDAGGAKFVFQTGTTTRNLDRAPGAAATSR